MERLGFGKKDKEGTSRAPSPVPPGEKAEEGAKKTGEAAGEGGGMGAGDASAGKQPKRKCHC